MEKVKYKDFSNLELQKLRIEYALYENDKEPITLGGARVLINSYIEYIEDFVKLGRRQCVSNNLIHIFGEVENEFLSLFGIEKENLGYLDEDLGVVLDQIALSLMFKNYFVAMRDSLSGDNMIQMCKLASFVKDKYLSNYTHLESVRDVITNRELGMISEAVGVENRMTVQDFFREQYTLITTKNIEKIKRI